jgi:ABC-2 type transport system permease protein
LGEFAQLLLLKAIPVALFTALILGALPPANLTAMLLFIAGVLLSIILLFFIEFIIGLCSFYTMNYDGVRFAKDALLLILSGALVPLAMFPDGLRQIFAWLPFQYLGSVPVNAYLGVLSVPETLKALGVEVLWIIALYILSVLFYRTAIRKVVVQGG